MDSNNQDSATLPIDEILRILRYGEDRTLPGYCEAHGTGSMRAARTEATPSLSLAQSRCACPFRLTTRLRHYQRRT